VSAVELVEDLIELEELAEQERDASRRRRLVALADRVAHRDAGAKVSEAAEVLGISAPTIRAWITAGLLAPVPGCSPVRIELSSLAAAKRAVDAVRQIKDEPQILAEVYCVLRDRDVLDDRKVRQGLADYRADRAVDLTPELLDELLPPPRRRKSSPKSH